MKLQKKNFLNLNNLNFRLKFVKCKANLLKRGDYINIVFFWSNHKRRKGMGIRLNRQTGILLRKLVHHNSMTLILSVLFKYEKVKFYFIINSPQIITVKFLRKSLRRNLLLQLLK